MIYLLLNNGAKIDALDSFGRTALHCAARNSQLDVAAALLEKGADTEILDCDGFSALHVAAEASCEEIVSLLIEEGADLNARIEKEGANDGSST